MDAEVMEQEKNRNARINLVLDELLRSDGGKEMLRWLLRDVCGVMRVTLADDALKTAYNLGAVGVGQKLVHRLEQVAASPSLVGVLLLKPDTERSGK